MWKAESSHRLGFWPHAFALGSLTHFFSLCDSALQTSRLNLSSLLVILPNYFRQVPMHSLWATLSATVVMLSTWILCHDVRNSYPLFYYRISQGKITHAISHSALTVGIKCVYKHPWSSVYSKELQWGKKKRKKKGYLSYPNFLIAVNIPDSFGIAALQTFVMSQICISDHRFSQIYETSLFSDKILSSNIETELPLQRYKATL